MKSLLQSRIKLGFLVRTYEVIIVVLVLWFAKPDNPSLALGGGLSLAGVLFRVWSSGYIRKKTDTEVFGPYRFVRHPHDLGTFLLLLGFSVASRNFYITCLMLLGSLLILWQIFREEEYLTSTKLGLDYRDYRIHVPTLIPNLLPYRGPLLTSKRFSFGKAFFTGRRRHEFESMVAATLVYMVLYGLTKIPGVQSFQTVVGSVSLIYGIISLSVYARRRQIVTGGSRSAPLRSAS